MSLSSATRDNAAKLFRRHNYEYGFHSSNVADIFGVKQTADLADYGRFVGVIKSPSLSKIKQRPPSTHCIVKGGRSVYLKPCLRTYVDDEVLNHEETRIVRGKKCVKLIIVKDGGILLFPASKGAAHFCTVSASRNGVLAKPSLPVRKSFHGVAVYF